MDVARAGTKRIVSRPQGEIPRAAHAVVVLGCSANADGTPAPPLKRRLERALDELRRDPAAVAIVTGGAVWNAAPEAVVMKRWLVEQGVDPRRVVLEDRARLTIENAEYVMPLLERVGASTLTLVTERFHMNRSRRLFDAALDNAGLDHVRVVESEAPDDLAGFTRMATAFKELRAMARDVVNQRQLHKGKPLVFVPQQITQIDAWHAPPPGYIDVRALFARPKDAPSAQEEAERLRRARAQRHVVASGT